MIALACLLGIAAIVWLLVKDAQDRDYEAEAYTDVVEFSDWSEWTENPDDPNVIDFDFPEREAA